jgi:hypothetical protein
VDTGVSAIRIPHGPHLVAFEPFFRPAFGKVRRTMTTALLGRLCITAATLLVVMGFFLPTHDYAGLGDPVLDRIVSDDARDVTAMLAAGSVLLAGTAMVVIRSRRFVIGSAVVLALGLVNLVRLAQYY